MLLPSSNNLFPQLLSSISFPLSPSHIPSFLCPSPLHPFLLLLLPYTLLPFPSSLLSSLFLSPSSLTSLPPDPPSFFLHFAPLHSILFSPSLPSLFPPFSLSQCNTLRTPPPITPSLLISLQPTFACKHHLFQPRCRALKSFKAHKKTVFLKPPE